MNNTQFRRLVLDTPNVKSNGNKEALAATPRRDGVSQAALGSRMRSSIPMTPYLLPPHRPAPQNLHITDDHNLVQTFRRRLVIKHRLRAPTRLPQRPLRQPGQALQIVRRAERLQAGVGLRRPHPDPRFGRVG